MSSAGTLHVEVIETPELGDRSYIVHDESEALVIDPQRDLDRVYERLDRLGISLAMVGETHIHNDYLTGGLVLARRRDVPYLVAASERVDYPRTAIDDGAQLQVGSLSVRVVATPGHTPNHVAFVVTMPGQPPAVFTGGSLLYGTVGRTDLTDAELAEEYARVQHRSVRRLAAQLPDDAAVFPTHGFGSFCSAAPGAQRDAGTIGEERTINEALREDDEAGFARRQVDGLMPYPAYYERMAPLNRRGVHEADLSTPAAVTPGELVRRIAAGEWVVDLRPRRDFAADHLRGTLSFELGRPFATYLGWLFDYDQRLTLLGESAADIAAAQRQLTRIGIDQIDAATGPVAAIADESAGRGCYPVVEFHDVPRKLPRDAVILDVRHDAELRAGSIRDAHQVPLARLVDDPSRLPAGQLWVHCASGFRASIAASLLDRAGRDVVLIDDEFASAVDLGIAA